MDCKERKNRQRRAVFHNARIKSFVRQSDGYTSQTRDVQILDLTLKYNVIDHNITDQLQEKINSYNLIKYPRLSRLGNVSF